MNNKSLIGTSLFTLGALLAGGCATQREVAAVNLETRDSSSIVVGKPIVRREGDGYAVRGSVHRPSFSPLTSRGHVHVEVVDTTGQVLQTAYAKFAPPPGRKSQQVPGPRTGEYEAFLSGPMPDGTTVRVSAASDSHPSEN